MKKNKIVFLGDGGVGKTSIIIRYIRSKFESSYLPTLKEDYTNVDIAISPKEIVKTDIIDTSGQDEFRALSDSMIMQGDLFIIVYSIVDVSSFEKAKEQITEVKMLRGNKINFILVGNKADLEDERTVQKQDGKNLATYEKGKFIETSALIDSGITELFQIAGASFGKKARCLIY